MPACLFMIAGRAGGEKDVLLGVSGKWRGSPLRRGACPGIGGVPCYVGERVRESAGFSRFGAPRRGKVTDSGTSSPSAEGRPPFLRRVSRFGGEHRRFRDVRGSRPLHLSETRGFCAARQNVSAQKALSGRNSEFWGKGFMRPSRWARKIAYFSPCLADFARFLMVLGNKFYGVGASISNLLPKTR